MVKFKDTTKNEKNTEIESNNISYKNSKLEIVSVCMLVIAVLSLISALLLFYKVYSINNQLKGSTLYKAYTQRDNENDTLEETYKLMLEVDNIYKSCYVEEDERDDIDNYIINALVSSYGDHYGVYKDPYESHLDYVKRESSLEGVGIMMIPDEYNKSDDNFNIYIIKTYEGSGAEKAGLEKGDLITHVNGKRLSKTKYTYNEVQKDIRGLDGTTVEITYIDAETSEEKTVEVTRGYVYMESVTYEMVTDDIAYININSFSEKTDEEFINIVTELQNKGIKKYIFDIRRNNGGLSTSIAKTLDELLPSGLIFEAINKDGKVSQRAESDEHCVEFESVTLTSNTTASAAELFAQALKDYKLTTIVGDTTLGKGTVCTLIPLSNGGSIFVSTDKYKTISGTEIEGIGVMPDIEMRLSLDKRDIWYKLPLEDDDMVQKAIEILHCDSQN